MEEGLLLKIKDRDTDAYAQLYNAYNRKIYKTALMIVNDADTAEDILQEVFMQIFLKIHTLQDTEAFELWLYRITVNCCMKHFGKIKRFGRSVEQEKFSKEAEVDIDYLPEENYIKRELSEKVWDVISSLSQHHRITVILYYYNEFSIKEIADLLKCSEGTVKSRLHYSKLYLKEKLEKLKNQ